MQPIDLSPGDLLYYGGVEWLNISDFLGKIKKGLELHAMCFVFKSAVVFLCKERLRQKKKLMVNHYYYYYYSYLKNEVERLLTTMTIPRGLLRRTKKILQVLMTLQYVLLSKSELTLLYIILWSKLFVTVDIKTMTNRWCRHSQLTTSVTLMSKITNDRNSRLQYHQLLVVDI